MCLTLLEFDDRVLLRVLLRVGEEGVQMEGSICAQRKPRCLTEHPRLLKTAHTTKSTNEANFDFS